MRRSHVLTFLVTVTCVVIALSWFLTGSHAQQQAGAAVAIDNDDIGGVVTSSKGPEAGVWVIAETRELGVRFIRSVVTDDQGRYVLPELPQATYSVWVRGYGLVDSKKITTTPGKIDPEVVVAVFHHLAHLILKRLWRARLYVAQHAQAAPDLAAEQIVDRHAAALAHDIPKRAVDSRHRIVGIDAAPPIRRDP